MAERHGAGSDAVALAAALALPWAGTVLSGAASAAQLETNLAAETISLDPDELHELRSLAVPAADYWRDRAALPWT
jgi:aryl-alcohol dehydrogenase-like predicted oxidoreductase